MSIVHRVMLVVYPVLLIVYPVFFAAHRVMTMVHRWYWCCSYPRTPPPKSPGGDPYATIHTGRGGLRLCGLARSDLELAGTKTSLVACEAG